MQMDNVKGTEREDLQRLHRQLEEEKEGFLDYSSRSMEDVEDADYDMLKRGHDLDEIRSMCNSEDKKLANLIEEQQYFLSSTRNKRMERLEDLEYFAKEKIKDYEAKQEDILYKIEKDKEKKNQQNKE